MVSFIPNAPTLPNNSHPLPTEHKIDTNPPRTSQKVKYLSSEWLGSEKTSWATQCLWEAKNPGITRQFRNLRRSQKWATRPSERSCPSAKKDAGTIQGFRIPAPSHPPLAPVIKRLGCFQPHCPLGGQGLWAHLLAWRALCFRVRAPPPGYSQNCRLRLRRASSAASASSSKKRLRKSIIICSVSSSWFHLKSGTCPVNKAEAISVCSELEFGN